MFKKRLPHSLRKFVRKRKAEIRRQFLSAEDSEKKIRELVAQLRGQYTKGDVIRENTESPRERVDRAESGLPVA